MKAIVTHEFKVLYLERGRIVQRHIHHVDDFSKVVCVIPFGEHWSLTVQSDTLHWFDFETGLMDRAVPNGNLQRLYNGENDTYGFLHNGYFMRANHMGTVDFVSEGCNLWESFRLYDLDVVEAASRVLRHRWIVNGGSELTEYNPFNSSFFSVVFGKWNISVDHFLSVVALRKDAKSFIFFEGWKAHEAVLFNPVLLLVVFGHGNALKQYEASMLSLDRLSHYHDDIVVVGNVDEHHLRMLAGPRLQDKIRVVRMEAADQLDYVGARLSIFNSTLLDQYQPILYSDVDIVFDADIRPFLIESALSRQCSAQVEPFHVMKEAEHTGAGLYKEDPFPLENVPGFNGGLLMVPNMDDHARYLRAGFTSMFAYTTESGRHSISFYDQSVLNYILYKMRDFSPSPVSERTQIGGPDFAIDPAHPKGFVHFWNAHVKHQAMTDYVNAVLSHKAEKTQGS